jgi:hypothetical protein
MVELISGCFAVAFACAGCAAFITAGTFASNYGSPQDNYRKSFNRTIECREKVNTPTNIDVICGRIPQWSEFVKESK